MEIIGIDIGTTSICGVVINAENGEVLKSKTVNSNAFLESDKLKFFRRVGNTEKPDIFCSKILEGRVGLVVDGSPVALSVPFVLLEDLQRTFRQALRKSK